MRSSPSALPANGSSGCAAPCPAARSTTWRRRWRIRTSSSAAACRCSTIPDKPGFKLVASPFRIDEPLPARPAPKLGEHTDALLRELGYGEADIERLKQGGAV